MPACFVITGFAINASRIANAWCRKMTPGIATRDKRLSVATHGAAINTNIKVAVKKLLR